MFLNIDPEHAWVLRHTAAKVAKIIKGFIEEGLGEVDLRHAKVINNISDQATGSSFVSTRVAF